MREPQVEWEAALNDFDPRVRSAALERLLKEYAGRPRPEGGNVNLHLHSFFSYNAAGWSPSRLVWEARKAGLFAAGLCDFDVLDGLDECLTAGARAGLRVTVNLETRATIPELAAVDINSPGEPGVAYIMGGGFPQQPDAGSAAARTLDDLRARAGERNRALIGRINERLPEIAVDYARDVLPLTPGGNATERHIIRAYTRRAAESYPDRAARAAAWARILDRAPDATATLMDNVPAFEEAVRARLVKRGGIGYEQPAPGAFPNVDPFVRWVLDCGAVPLTTWLDGTSAGEADPDALLDLLTAKGCAGVNIIPDRNWNVSDPDKRRRLVACLDAFVNAAVRRHQPINIGTEMNKDGLPFFDDLAGSVLGRYQALFLRGAALLVGHTVLGRYAGCPYTGDRAQAEFPDLPTRNRFFESVGRLPALTTAVVDRFRAQGPEATFVELADRVRTDD